MERRAPKLADGRAVPPLTRNLRSFQGAGDALLGGVLVDAQSLPDLFQAAPLEITQEDSVAIEIIEAGKCSVKQGLYRGPLRIV